MNSYDKVLEYLYGLQGRGMKFGLRNIKTLLRSVGNPERQFRSIHIAGTNGKGSTASFLASIFMEAGYKTGLYTSPHLIRFTERIRINGEEISEKRLVEYAKPLLSLIEETNATFFEATTCIAFQHFADQKVDIAIVEAGLGGRLDSTNVLRPLVSVITNVSFDHTEYLGNTIKKIAREKGGIIKKDTPCVTCTTNQNVLTTLRGIAKRRSSRLIEVQKRISPAVIRRMKPGLSGEHQMLNAACAIVTIDTLKREQTKTFRRLGRKAIKAGLIRVQKNTGLHGRLEVLGKNKQYILDVAHNPAGLETLMNALPSSIKKNLIVVFGVMRDKDYCSMCRTLALNANCVVSVQPQTSRALTSAEIIDSLKATGIRAIDGGSVRNGILVADGLLRRRGKILVTGSHYVVGEALELLKSTGHVANA